MTDLERMQRLFRPRVYRRPDSESSAAERPVQIGKRPAAWATLRDTMLAFRPGAPQCWQAPNGLTVYANPDSWNGSFHDAQVDSERQGYCWCEHRHIGPAVRAIRAYCAAFAVSPTAERNRLRALVRSGD